MNTSEQVFWRRIGKLAHAAIERRRDKPKLAVLAYMEKEFSGKSVEVLHARLPSIFKQSRKIWEENL